MVKPELNEDNVDISGTDDEEDMKTDTGQKEPEPQALDGGYGWLVVLGCFISHIVTGGIERSDGVVYLQFLKRFNQSAQLTAWPGAIMSTMNLCLGPIASAICNRYSVRSSVMVAGILISAGCILNGFSPNLYFLFFSHSLLVGCGRGLSYAPGLILVGMYFDKKRGFATGLGSSGVGVGTFLLAPITQFLFDTFGYQRTFLILGGIALNMNVAAMLYRPLSMHYRLTRASWKKGIRVARGDTTIAVVDTNKTLDVASLKTLRLAEGQHYNSKELESLTSSQNELNDDQVAKEKFIKNEDNCLCSSLKICFPIEHRMDKNDRARRLCHFYLLKNPSFLLYCLSVWFFTMAMKSAFMFMPALVKFKGISESQASMVLSVAGAVDALARIGAGFVLDTRRLKPYRSILYNMIMLAIAVVAFVLPSIETFESFVVLCSIYGILTGAYVSQKSVIIVDILGIKHMSSSLGILICFQSFGTLLGPPLSGALKDYFGSFAEAFYLGGGFMIAASGLMLTSNLFLRLCKQRQ